MYAAETPIEYAPGEERPSLGGGAVIAAAVGASAEAEPLNVILFVGDGMGLEAVKLARGFDNGNTAPLTFENPAIFPHFATMTHNNASGGTTDSAASGTAMATGTKVNNGVISVRQPGDGSNLLTALEFFRAAGKSTGLVTNSTDITDATPSAFGAHNSSRNNKADILNDLLTQSAPNVLFGRRSSSFTSAAYDSAAGSAGYTVVHNTTELLALNTTTTTRALGNWTSSTEPSLVNTTITALNLLDNNAGGFFLLVEEEATDSGGHANNAAQVKDGVLELRNTVDATLAWAAGSTDTLIIVTADHETGGLTVGPGPYSAGLLPSTSWSTTGHTQTAVGVWALGPNAEQVTGAIDNTDIFTIMTGITQPPAPPPPPGQVVTSFAQGANGYSGTVDTYIQENSPAADNSAALSINVDAQDPSNVSPNKAVQGLLRFDGLFGDGPGQIPTNATIASATLQIDVSNSGAAINLHRLLVDWDDTDTWNHWGNGVQVDGVEAAALYDVNSGAISTGLTNIDVTTSLVAWLSASHPNLANHGWVLIPTGTDGIDFSSAEGAYPPTLLVTYTTPVPEPTSAWAVAALLGLLNASRPVRRRGAGSASSGASHRSASSTGRCTLGPANTT